MRTISGIMAILIVIVITVSVGLVIGVVLPRYMEKHTPKKGVVVLASCELNINEKLLVIRGIYQGGEKAILSSVNLYISDDPDDPPDQHVDLEPVTPYPILLKPNSEFKLILRITDNLEPPIANAKIILEYCFFDNTCLNTHKAVKINN